MVNWKSAQIETSPEAIAEVSAFHVPSRLSLISQRAAVVASNISSKQSKPSILSIDLVRHTFFNVLCFAAGSRSSIFFSEAAQGRIGTYNFVVPGLSEPLF